MGLSDEVSELVRPVLRSISEPYGEYITLQVFIAIEANPEWLRRYKQIADEYDRGAINQMIGKEVKFQTGMKDSRRKGMPYGTTLITKYTILTH